MAPTRTLVVASLLQTAVAFLPAAPVGRTLGTSSRARFPRVQMLAKRKGDLFKEIEDLESGDKPEKSTAVALPETTSFAIPGAKEKAILAPEETFFEGPPSWTEMVLPGISILTVIGIVPFLATVSRQAWVKYKITSRRISVTSGFNGQDLTEITYDEIYTMKYVYRSFGSVGDLVIELKDGAKLEMRSVPDFDDIYAYIFERTSKDCQEYSDATKAMKDAKKEAAE